jgi:ATP-dependent protease HslVU (ClpYQ) peptidase subunit
MTVIVGWRDKKSAWIGGDAGAFDDGVSSASSVVISAEPKVWKTPDGLVGVAGSFRLMDIARKSGIGDPYKLRDFLVGKKIENAGFPESEWTVLVVNKKGVFEICEDFSVIKNKDNYTAVGAASDVALGALAVLEGFKELLPQKRIELVLSASAYHSTMARPPFKILQL